MEHHHVMIQKQLLLAGHIDFEIRIVLIEIVDLDALQTFDRCQEALVDPRPPQRRVGEKDENSLSFV
jgi:hypothetical protein